MKNILTTLTLILLSFNLMAQSPDKISYQALVRNSSNALIVNQQVGVKVSVLQGTANGTAVYTETHTPTTNSNGLISIEIGGGVITADSLNKVNWANGPYFIKTEIDPSGGVNYSISGTTQLLSVPYALHARTADSIVGGTNFSGNYNDLTNKPITISNIVGDTFKLSNGGYILSAKNVNSSITLPAIATRPVSAITTYSAVFGGTIVNLNGSVIVRKGIVYSKIPNPARDNGISTELTTNDVTIPFDSINTMNYIYYASPSGSIYTLLPGTLYYVRAYAVTENNICVYGNQVTFTTSALVPPTILTNPVSGITSNSAKFSGNVSNANGNLIVARGWVYSTTPNPNVNSSKKIVIGSGIGSLDTTLSYNPNPENEHFLTPNTTYYVKAYTRVQSDSFTYGNQISFTTLSIGQTGTGGGIVFFNKGDTIGGWQFLEAELTNRNFVEGDSMALIMGCNGTLLPVTNPEIGYGEINTNIIVANCSDSLFSPAKTCFNLVQGGQSDWFLPSIDELSLMYRNLVFTNNLNIANLNGNVSAYWSSTELGEGQIYLMNGNGEKLMTYKFGIPYSFQNIGFKAIRAY